MQAAGHNSGNFEVSLFGDPRIKARLPAPQGLSQVTTSFVGSWCQGIHRLHLVACCLNLQRCSRPLCNSQNTGETKPHKTNKTFHVRLTARSQNPRLQNPTACKKPTHQTRNRSTPKKGSTKQSRKANQQKSMFHKTTNQTVENGSLERR